MIMFNYGKWPHLQPIPATIEVHRARPRPSAAKRQDELLDDALKDTFHASDPISVGRAT
ncbi:hypothetical protein SH591_11585 [Sphingomonas sp. LY54]|uniref:hypothetical protein n=1 Tax=Sphingomonas sp. LY54 TaxID=3095343 RepID=UPI002D794CE7|nr:hypothetical protein [Sphingomonas sp. LY54]WRP27744.1 hypothetical protein SH591_11585 [Sphingomonas sp. LY54]